jgi:hypothetical protein
MVHLPLAFSVHHFINSVGADAGFASIIGLAILVLLYFAQARETATLRERTEASEEHAAQLEARLAHVSRAQAAQAQAPPGRPAPAMRPVINPAQPGVVAAAAPVASRTVAVPSAPAGVGAPALAAATRLIPLPSSPSTPAPVVAEPATPAPAPTPASAPLAVPGIAPATAAAAAAPATAAGGSGTGNGFFDDTMSSPVAVADEPLAEPLPRVQLRPGGGGSGGGRGRQAPPPPRRGGSSQPPSRFGRGLALLLTAVGVVAVVIVLLVVTSSGGSKSNSSTGSTKTTNSPTAKHKTKAKPFNKAAVTVTVLNGTSTAGLAAKLLAQLGGDGYTQGQATNAANQTQATTIVSYMQGKREAALQVAASLKLPTSRVSPINSTTQSIACPQTTCSVDVVVTIGQDLASQ